MKDDSRLRAALRDGRLRVEYSVLYTDTGRRMPGTLRGCLGGLRLARQDDQPAEIQVRFVSRWRGMGGF